MMYKIHSSTKETLYPPAVIQMFVGFTAHFLTLPHRSSQTDVYLWICLILFYPMHPKTEPLTYTLVPTIPAPSRIPPGLLHTQHREAVRRNQEFQRALNQHPKETLNREMS